MLSAMRVSRLAKASIPGRKAGGRSHSSAENKSSAPAMCWFGSVTGPQRFSRLTCPPQTEHLGDRTVELNNIRQLYDYNR
jgi:hypothetical protein